MERLAAHSLGQYFLWWRHQKDHRWQNLVAEQMYLPAVYWLPSQAGRRTLRSVPHHWAGVLLPPQDQQMERRLDLQVQLPFQLAELEPYRGYHPIRWLQLLVELFLRRAE